MNQALSISSQSKFIGETDDQNNPIPFDPTRCHQYETEIATSIVNVNREISSIADIAEKEWVYRQAFSTYTLLAHSCKSAAILSNSPEPRQNLAFQFGKNFALLCLAYIELKDFPQQLRLSSLPVLFHLQHNSKLYHELYKERVLSEKAIQEIYNGPALEKTKFVQHKYSHNALKILRSFPESEAKDCLIDIVLSLNSNSQKC